MKIFTTAFAVLTIALFSPAVSLADDTLDGSLQEQADPALDSAVTTPLDEELTSEPDGKTMAEFVDEAMQGKKRYFNDEETMAVMRASRAVKGTDRELARKLEKIAAKISNL